MATANKIMLVSDRVERAKSFLLSQFKDKPNINALVDSLVSELQELEKTINDIQTARTLEGSFGWWTDQISNELDISRGNYADNDFKTAIKIAMAKQTASASVEDILKIVSLITGDTDAQLNNDAPYMMELFSWLFCVSDSYDGLNSLAQLFPMNTRVRLVKHDSLPFTLGVAGRGFGSSATLCDLAYYRNGHSEDQRFVTTPTQDIPPMLSSKPTISKAPYIYGDNSVGKTLTLSQGEYFGDEPLALAYQWLKNGFNIASANNLTYVLVTGDEGSNISCRVTVSNTAGSLIANTNIISISGVVPPTATITPSLGIRSVYAFLLNPSSSGVSVTNTVSVTFKSDGNTTIHEHGSPSNSSWTTVPSSGIGANYKMYYQALSGPSLVGLNENAHYTLSSDIVLQQSVTSRYGDVVTGQYTFYIYEIANPANIVSKTITITAEIGTDL